MGENKTLTTCPVYSIYLAVERQKTFSEMRSQFRELDMKNMSKKHQNSNQNKNKNNRKSRQPSVVNMIKLKSNKLPPQRTFHRRKIFFFVSKKCNHHFGV